LVRAGLHDHVHLASGIASEGCVVGAGEHLKLTDGVDGRVHREAVELRVAIVNTVEQKIVGVLPAAIHVDGEVAADRSGRARRGGNHAWKEQTELVEIAAVERKPENGPRVNDTADGGGFG